MAKISVWGLKRPQRKSTRIEVTDDSNPGQTFTFTLREPTLPIMIDVGNLIEDKTKLYITGEGLPEKASLPLIEGIPIELKDETLQLACAITILQDGDETEKYTFEEVLVLIETMEKGMLGLISYAKDILTKYVELIENPIGAVIIPQSESI